MPIQINLPDETSGRLFTDSYKISAVAQLAEFEQLTSPRDQVIYSFTGADAKFHSPGGPDKSAGDDVVLNTRVNIECMYKVIEIYDKIYDDAVGKKIIDQIEAKIPGIMALSLDKTLFGPEAIDDAPFEGPTEVAVEVDATAASWLAAIATLEAKKQTPSAFILDESFKAAVRVAFTEGSMTNPLTFGVQDGFSIAGIPVYFRHLGTDAAGDPFGLLGDFSKVVVFSYDEFEELEIHLPGQDWALRLKNRIGIYAGWRLGVGVATQKALLPLKLVADVTG